MTVDVTDGTSRAFLKVSGSLLWMVLQATAPTLGSAVRGAVEASGSMKWTRDTGSWACRGGPLSDDDRAAVASVWPSSVRRRVSCVCIPEKRAPAATQRHDLDRWSKAHVGQPTLRWSPQYVTLVALDIAMPSARSELERALAV